jgi:intracellular multiplication protein IcmP
MGQGAPQQQQQSDNALAPLWIMGLALAVGWLLWKVFHAEIVTFAFHAKILQAQLVNMVTHNMSGVIAIMKAAVPAQVTFEQLTEASTIVGNYMRYPIMFILVVLAVILYISDITQKFRKTYSMDTLLNAEKKLWPHVIPVAKLNLIDQDVTKGPWAMCLPPMRFARKYKLLDIDNLYWVQTGGRREVPVAGIKRGLTKRIFILQLGPIWEGPEALTPARRALFAIFAARINRDRDVATAKLEQIARSTERGKLDFSGCDALLRKYYNTELVQKAVQTHAYVLTVMAAMLVQTRNDGVFATADFLWLKPVDRVLWYMLNSVGRQTPFVEVAGPFAHWIAEDNMGRPLKVPMVDEAVNALEGAIAEIIYKPEGDEKVPTP